MAQSKIALAAYFRSHAIQRWRFRWCFFWTRKPCAMASKLSCHGGGFCSSRLLKSPIICSRGHGFDTRGYGSYLRRLERRRAFTWFRAAMPRLNSWSEWIMHQQTYWQTVPCNLIWFISAWVNLTAICLQNSFNVLFGCSLAPCIIAPLLQDFFWYYMCVCIYICNLICIYR